MQYKKKNTIWKLKFGRLVLIGILLNMSICFSGCTDKSEDSFGIEVQTMEEGQELTEDLQFFDTGQTIRTDSTKENAVENTIDNIEEHTEEYILVHVCGAVVNPGVYELLKGQRVIDGVKMAGGFLEEAAQNYVNQAQILEDGIKLIIPTLEEVEQMEAFSLYGVQENQADSAQAENKNGLINLNTADAGQLSTLPGIGQAKAEAIIKYRSDHGNFKSTEEVMQIEGIKEGLYNKIKDLVCIK